MWLKLAFLLVAVGAPSRKPPTLVPLPTQDELFDADDMEASIVWLASKLEKKVQEADAKDLLNSAVLSSFPGEPFEWKRVEGGRRYAVHLVYRVTDIRRNERRRKGFRVEEDPPSDRAIAAPASQEAELLREERHRRLHDDARAHFADSPVVEPILERLFLGEITSDDVHAKETGLTRDQVRNARARILAFCQDREAKEKAEEAKA